MAEKPYRVVVVVRPREAYERNDVAIFWFDSAAEAEAAFAVAEKAEGTVRVMLQKRLEMPMETLKTAYAETGSGGG